MMSRKINKSLITAVSLSVLLSACGQPEQSQQKMPAPAVSVYNIASDQVGNYREFVLEHRRHNRQN